MAERYLLETWLGTSVYVSELGELRHATLEHYEQALKFELTADLLLTVQVEGDTPNRLLQRFATNAFSPTIAANLTCHFHFDGWLCAEVSGAVVDGRTLPGAWETFRLIPYLPEEMYPLAINRQDSGYQIPFCIHQIFLGSPRVPSPIIDCSNGLREQNPEFEYTLWREEEVIDAIQTWYGYDILRYYLQINPRYKAARADLFRYLLLYQKGGVYLDLKSGFSRPLHSILRPKDRFLLSQWEDDLHRFGFGCHPELAHVTGGEYQQWFIISEAGHSYLEQVILRVIKNIHQYQSEIAGVGMMGVLRTTGPIPYTLAIHLMEGEHRLIKSHTEGLEYTKYPNQKKYLGTSYRHLTDEIVLW